MNSSGNARLPPVGVRVIEFCSTADGPFCAMLLSDMGGEIVKVEPPAGDGLRQWPPLSGDFSENFASLNRNKRSAVLDLKEPRDRAVALGLVLDADIVVENNRPGVMDRLGLGYADGAFAIAAALAEVRAGGQGAHIDIPMFGCTLAIGTLQASGYFGNGRSPGQLGSAHLRNAPYQAFPAADGHFVLAAGNHKLWLDVLHVVQATELAADPRFLTTTDRARNQRALKDILEQRFVRQPVEHWIAAFNAAGVPHGRINDYANALADPQVAHMGWVQQLTLPGGAQTRTFASTIQLNGADFPIRQPPPLLGEHTDEIRARYNAPA